MRCGCAYYILLEAYYVISEMNDKFRVSFSTVCYLQMCVFKMFCECIYFVWKVCMERY